MVYKMPDQDFKTIKVMKDKERQGTSQRQEQTKEMGYLKATWHPRLDPGKKDLIEKTGEILINSAASLITPHHTVSLC